MKVIKLDHRHNLKRKGFDWAFKFDGWSSRASTVESAVRQAEGFNWNSTFWGKAKGRSGRPYYVGFRKESTATMVVLKVGV
jgi:hypothetical protein